MNDLTGGFTTDWLKSIQGLNPGQGTTFIPPTMRGLAGVGGQGDIASAIREYTQSLGKMGTMDYVSAGLGGIQTIGGLIGALGSLSLAKKQFAFNKRMMETNLTNQVGAYNTALEDKARSRAVVEGISAADTASYIDKHKAVAA